MCELLKTSLNRTCNFVSQYSLQKRHTREPNVIANHSFKTQHYVPPKCLTNQWQSWCMWRHAADSGGKAQSRVTTTSQSGCVYQSTRVGWMGRLWSVWVRETAPSPNSGGYFKPIQGVLLPVLQAYRLDIYVFIIFNRGLNFNNLRVYDLTPECF